MDTGITHSRSQHAGADRSHRKGGVSCASRALALATLVVALAGFAGTSFSAAPGELFGQPATCIVSH